MTCTASILNSIQEVGEDFEWYPTTQRMIAVVAKAIGPNEGSIMDIGAGDGRVLLALSKYRTYGGEEQERKLFAIEKSTTLVQAWPENVTPVGADLWDQNLACLPVDFIFSNPPYSQFEPWTSAVIESGYAKRAFLVIPRRWKESDAIARSLKKRGATARIIHSDDFLDADRKARAIVDIVEISYPCKDDYHQSVKDPFDIWFDQNIDTFERESESRDEDPIAELAKTHKLQTIADMVESFNEEYALMEANYRAIFKLDYAILKELQVNKEAVRDGIKKRMAGLKTKYWQLLFDRLDTITKRLSTETKNKFLKKLTGQAQIAFTANNAYAVVLWAIKRANKYYNAQLIQLFRDLSTFEGALNYKSNQRTWNKDGWRYNAEDHSHYLLDYRIVVRRHNAIVDRNHYSSWQNRGGLAQSCHELIADITAVFYNLGYVVQDVPSYERTWVGGKWQDFCLSDSVVLFQTKAFQNGNVHLRFMPKAIRALNVEAGRLLGWIRSTDDAAEQMNIPRDEAVELFGCHKLLVPSSIKLLAG